MNFKKILAATSMLAVVAMPAHALRITDIVTAPMAAALPASFSPADELLNPEDLLSGIYTFDVRTNVNEAYPLADNIIIKIDLPPNLQFRTAAVGANVLPGTNSAVNTALGAAVGVAVPVAGAVVQAGGAVGDTTVTFALAMNTGTLDDVIQFAFDLEVLDCKVAPTGVLAVDGSFSTGANLGTIHNPTLPASSLLAHQCGSAIDGVVTSDEGTSDTEILLPGYTTLSFGGTTSTIGAVNYAINAARARDITNSPVLISDVSLIQFNVEFEDDAGVTGVTVGGIAATPLLAPNANSWRILASSTPDLTTLLDGVADPIVITVNGTTQIVEQNIVVNNATVSFEPLPPGGTNTEAFIVSEAGAMGSLDRLDREGQTFGYFDWNAETGKVNSLYRVTGFSSNVDVPYTVTMTNSSGGMNGVYAGLIPAAALTSGETILSSRTNFGLGAWATSGDMTGYKRGDVRISFETSDALDVDRLISSDGFVANYGGGANSTDMGQAQQPNTDTDDVDGNE